MTKKEFNWVKGAKILGAVGALNWGLIALNSNWNVVQGILGVSIWSRIVYGLVGVAGVVILMNLND